jgi:hypothetical protein
MGALTADVKRARSPDPLDAVSVGRGIGTDDRESLDAALGNEKPVKRVAMNRGQIDQRVNVSRGDFRAGRLESGRSDFQ